VVNTVSFTGERCGVVAFYIRRTADGQGDARHSRRDVNGEMPDAIEQITNMIAGTFRTKMAAAGSAWAISMPTVTGTSIPSKSATCGAPCARSR
jgi:hypothetical protein